MGKFNTILTKAKLKTLTLIAPTSAGKLATSLFIESRNAANPYRKSFVPMGARALSVNTGCGKVKQVYIWGDKGDVVLLLHGWGANCASMFGFVPSLQKSGFRVATFDAPAHGSSEGEFASMMEYMQTTREVIDQINTDVGPVTKIIAHSLGGIIATAVSARMSKIEQMVLISAPYSLVDVLNIWASGFMKLSQTIENRIFSELLKMNGVPVQHWTIGLHSKHVKIPVMVIHDDKDRIVNLTHLSRIASAFKFGSTKVTHGFGHFKILSNREVHQSSVDFFNRHQTELLGEAIA
ncbi:MAG: alpha/beta hydrolase [Agarilytica sp.]